MNTDVPEKLKRQGQMFAPFTAHMQGADAAAAKLVDHRLQRAGGPMPSQVGPPAPALARPAATKPAFGMAAATFGQPHATWAEAQKPPATVPEVLARTLLSRSGQQALGYTPDPPRPGETEFNPSTGKWEPVAAPPAQKLTRPIASASPAGIAGAVNAGARVLSALAALPKAPAQGSTKLPGAPTLDANGNPVYDDAFAARNQPLLQRYAQQNVVQSVVPPPGVAATMAGGQTPAVGQLRRGGAGFTAADRMAQLDSLSRLSMSRQQSRATEAAAKGAEDAARLARYGDPRAAAVGDAATRAGQLAGTLQMPQRVAQFDPNAAAAAANDGARIAIEQGRAESDAALTRVQTQQGQLQLQQAQQMQALTQQLLGGTPEQQKAAAASLSALQGTKPGEPIKVKRQIDTGQKDAYGAPVLAEQEVLYDPRTGQWIQPPAAGAGQLPPGMTKEQVAAEAKAALAAGAPEDVVRSRLAAYGVSL